MTKDSLIEMKIGPQNSNPAKNEVLEASKDSVLSAYLREISSYPQLTLDRKSVV